MTGSIADALAAAKRDLELEWAREEQREIELTQAERLGRDPVAFLNSGEVWIRTPFGEDVTVAEIDAIAKGQKRKLHDRRFHLYPGQAQTIEAWIDLPTLAATGDLFFRNVVIEKSRAIGETWLFAGLICWALHYHPVRLFAMHNETAKIDDGGLRNTIESLFGKVRFIDKRLNRDRIPGLGTLSFRPYSREPAKVENQAKGSIVVGGKQDTDTGRGSTFDGLLIDEAAFVEHGEQVYSAIDEACPQGKALLSTVHGNGNFHARLATEKPADWTYLRLHWSDHPVYRIGLHIAGHDPACTLCEGTRQKIRWDPSDPRSHRYPGKPTSVYYEARVVGKTDEQVANELDIDRERAKTGRVYPEFQSGVHVVEAGIPYDPGLQHVTELAFDYGLDVTSVLVFQDAPWELRLVGILECGHLFGTSGVPENVAAALVAYLRELGVEERLLTPEWTRRMYAVGDPAGHNKTLETGQPYVLAYRRNGFTIGRPSRRLSARITPSVTAAKLLLEGTPKPLRVCGVKAQVFVEHARENTWRMSPDGQVLGLNDDVHNHAMRAFAYYALAKFPPVEERQPAGATEEDRPQEDPLERRRARARGEASRLRPGAHL